MTTDRSDPAHRWTWERSLRERSALEGLSPTAQHLALMLATYATPAGGGIRPSVATLCTATGRGRTVVNGALTELRERGWIRQTRRGSGGSKQASEYVLAIPREHVVA